MIVIVPKWMEGKVPLDMIAYCWLYVILEDDGTAFVYKDRYGNQRFIAQSEIPDLIKAYNNESLYQTLINL